jgi:hypothetical protein
MTAMPADPDHPDDESTSTWIPVRELVGPVARHLASSLRYAKQQIIRGLGVGREGSGWIMSRGETPEGWPVTPLPATWRGGVIDWDAGLLKPPQRAPKDFTWLPSNITKNVKICLEDLVAWGLLPKGKEAELARWSAAMAIAWLTCGKPLELWAWPAGMAGKIKPAQLKLRRLHATGQVRAWGKRSETQESPEQLPDDLFRATKYTFLVGPHGDLVVDPERDRHKYEEDH